jgi:Flp pilus assembly pilin Flp
MLKTIRQFLMEEEGAVAVEYVLLVVLIGLVFYVGANFLGNTLRDLLNQTATNLSNAANGGS